MAITSLQITYAEIRSHMALMMPVARSSSDWGSTSIASDISLMMRSGLRKAYYPPPRGNGQPAHQWSFLRPWATLTTNEPYSTGTITVANGVVTGSGTMFPSWATNGWLVYDGKYYEVASRGGNTALTLVDTSSDNDASAGTTYQLIQYLCDLPSDFESLAGPIYFHPDQSDQNIPLQRVGDIQLRQLYQDSETDSWATEPRFFALVPSAVAQSAIQSWKLMLWPGPTAVYHLKYRYNVQMSDLDGTDQYPPGGAQHSEMILEACLSEVELKYNDGPGPHTEKWLQLLDASIDLDRQISEADTYGVVPINYPDSQRSVALTDPGYVIREGYTLADYQT